MDSKENKPVSFLDVDQSHFRADRSRKWLVFNRSPLARKIVLFNLIALGILVSGILYLDQAADPDFQDRQGETFQNFIGSLVSQSNSIVQVYGNTGEIEISFTPSPRDKISAGTEADAFTNFLQNIWSALSPPQGKKSIEANRENLQLQFAELASLSMVSNDRTKNAVFSVGGEIYIAVALPISGPDGITGAILLSTVRGEVDTIIRGAREQILQMFLLATMSSVILSMVLANSIARPLRRLSAAAQNAHDEADAKINFARVNIPDLTARPDEIGDLSRSMRNMTDALLDRIDENKSFAADVAHEIKNPLTSLRSAVETLEYVRDDESRTALLEVILNDVERLDRLVTDISNASRLEGELVRDAWEEIDLCQLLASMAENFKQRGGYPDVNIDIEVLTRDCRIRGLQGRLEQVFTNLISNALSFVPADGWVHVTVSDSADNALIFEVSDSGPGIPADNLDDVFSRFYTERPVAQFGEHSGLGLAISKQIIEAHGGQITAQNTESDGALFTVKLPR